MPRLLMYSSEIEQEILQNEGCLVQCLRDIQTVAQTRNFALMVNGVLVVDNGRFLQILEGPHEAIEKLLALIMRDSRHRDIQILIDQPVPTASFTSWNMEVLILNGKDAIPIDELKKFRDSYLLNEKPNGRELGRWVRRLMTHPEIRFSGKNNV